MRRIAATKGASCKSDIGQTKGGWRIVSNYFMAFMVGSVLAGSTILLVGARDSRANRDGLWTSFYSSSVIAQGKRTVAQLIALSDAELEKADILEMNIAIAREISGLEKLDYEHYRQIVDGWTEQFRCWLPTVEYAFYQAPHKYKNDVKFFRLGMLAQFLDQTVGINYVEEQKQIQAQAHKEGRKVEILYTNPGDLFLHGLIDTKRGACGTMPALHVAIGRRMGWPVALACVNSHYVCRYDDGDVVYNIEATDTGRGGFAEGSD